MTMKFYMKKVNTHKDKTNNVFQLSLSDQTIKRINKNGNGQNVEDLNWNVVNKI